MPSISRWPALFAGCVLSVVSTTACGAIPGGDFANVGNDTVPRYFHAAGKLRSGEIMVSGGLGLQIFPPTLFSRGDISFYHPDTGQFTTSFAPLNSDPVTTPTLATARSSHTQTTLFDGRVLIAGGLVNASGTSPGGATASVEIFEPMTGTVTTGDAMTVARADHSATLMPNGHVVVAGGSTWQLFNPDTNQWSANVNLQRTRTAHAAVLLTEFASVTGDDRVLLIAGSGNGANTIEILDPATMTSTLLASTLTTGVDDLAATPLPDGDVLIVGGQNTSNGNTIASTYRLDPVSDILTLVDDVPNRAGGIADHEIARIGRFVAIFGGEQQQSGVDTILNYVALFDSDLNQWIADGTMNNVHDDFASVPLSACEILLIDGGFPLLGQEAPTANVEVFTLTIPDACFNGDVNNDGVVDVLDAAALSGLLVERPQRPDHILYADLNGDGFEDGLDLAVFVAVLLNL